MFVNQDGNGPAEPFLDYNDFILLFTLSGIDWLRRHLNIQDFLRIYKTISHLPEDVLRDLVLEEVKCRLKGKTSDTEESFAARGVR